MSKIHKIRGEVNAVMTETKYGTNPSWRRYAKRQHRKAVRGTKQSEIAHQLLDMVDDVIDAPVEFYSEPFHKTVQLDSMWHNHEIDRVDEDQWLRNRYPYMYHETDTWDSDESWVEDAEEFFGCEEF
jgi:hypothetical protein